ncbi:hypothetical protein DPMN_154990 [Dreissena polymorpha]|uniref:Uncharacterized protein n=1 Tax=Dreissena polymorpha TaxID=45954 RepID=A0A9D4FN37_DREPO|nr:hypothetical protein DPMN_154990 [Dreissena polymorpha]
MDMGTAVCSSKSCPVSEPLSPAMSTASPSKTAIEVDMKVDAEKSESWEEAEDALGWDEATELHA